MTKLFLAFNALIWMGYGAYCFLVPSVLAESAAVVAQSAVAKTELRAMYGGLQFALGELCLLALLRPAFTRAALLTIGFATSGLFTARLAGLVIDASGGSYTYGALGFEFVCVLGAWVLFGRQPAMRPVDPNVRAASAA